VAQYRAFLKQVADTGDDAWRHLDQPTPRDHKPDGWDELGPEADQLPVTGVDWFDAYAYCAWSGKRLPTEAEWERAALWDPLHEQAWKYPWGNQFLPSMCNSSELGVGGPIEVGSHRSGESPCGIQDACGNVWEWCADYYASRPLRLAAEHWVYRPPGGLPSSAGDMPWTRDARGPWYGDARVLRGGCWEQDGEDLLYGCRSRAFATARSGAIGFRCAWTPPTDPAVGGGEGRQ
jgi:formylglycine-generating enzyme required for sulfatase activity